MRLNIATGQFAGQLARKNGDRMKKAVAVMVTLLSSTVFVVAHDGDTVVRWRNIVGVITAPGIDNPVAVITDKRGNVVTAIHSGTLPWVTRSGNARVDLATGAVEFNVSGLVLNGGNATGTAGPINQVTGTLVCNPGSADSSQPQAILDTTPVSLSALGNARLSGELTANVPFPCVNPQFLIRIGPAFGDFAGRWLATGVEPRTGGTRDDDREREDHSRDR
jgi:hypothetical protein